MVKTITLTNSDELVLVDDQDYEYLNQFEWKLIIVRAGKRIARTQYTNGKCYIIYMSRIIGLRMGLNIKDKIIDHIDRNSVNNQLRSNLRIATHSQSQCNKGLYKNNTTGYKGVSWNNRKQKYVARIRINGKEIYLGEFNDLIEAAYQYDHYAKQLHGEFACLNFPEEF